MATPNKGQPSSITGKTIKGFDIEAGRRWKNVISKFERILLKLINAKSMRRFGYDPDNHPIFEFSQNNELLGDK
jgi:hypothetical protein